MKTEAVERVLIYGERRIPYHLRYSDRKRLRIVVKPDLSVSVESPSGFNETEVLDALRTKARWIIRQLCDFEDFHPLPTPHKFISGETFVYLGRQYRLKVLKGEKSPAKLRGRYLHVAAPLKSDTKEIKAALDAWYRARAGIVFRRYLARSMEIAHRHGVEEPPIMIRSMRTRWGSCTAAGRIILNIKLIQAPVHCIEYVIMHELCHLVHHNHSRQFYQLLSRCMPDWEKRRTLLRQVVFPFEAPLRL